MTVFGALVLIVSASTSASIGAREYPAPYDAAGQVEVLDQLIETTGGRYRLWPVDLFEEQRLYRARANSTMLSDVRFLHKTPDDPAFLRENEVIQNRLRPGDGNAGPDRLAFQRSLFVHTSFEIPGRQSYRLEAGEPVVVRGQLYRASIWVHSRMYRHGLSLLFRNADGHEVRAPLGPLLWHGWRRLEVQLPPELYRRGRNLERRYRHEFLGFLLTSHPKSEAGDVALMFDNLLIVADIQEIAYPGAELNF
ncbi:MAG: flagellar filament outer layer protein FlaA [Leptospirales bacterium]|jgi:hypothetical protein